MDGTVILRTTNDSACRTCSDRCRSELFRGWAPNEAVYITTEWLIKTLNHERRKKVEQVYDESIPNREPLRRN